jgi:hypothetical protein
VRRESNPRCHSRGPGLRPGAACTNSGHTPIVGYAPAHVDATNGGAEQVTTRWCRRGELNAQVPEGSGSQSDGYTVSHVGKTKLVARRVVETRSAG